MQRMVIVIVFIGLLAYLYDTAEAMTIGKSENLKSLWNSPRIKTVDLPDVIKNDPKYRIDCNPDFDEYKTFCSPDITKPANSSTASQSCTARGCLWDGSAINGIPKCYIPTEKGGYQLKEGPDQLSPAIVQYALNRLSIKPSHARSMSSHLLIESSFSTRANEFSMFGHDIDNLKVQVSTSGPQMLRMTIRDADAARYEVPVPIRWESSVSPTAAVPQMEFQMTKTDNGQVGFRIQRTNTGSVLFDTTYFSNGFIYDNQFLQIITTIPSQNIYGK